MSHWAEVLFSREKQYFKEKKIYTFKQYFNLKPKIKSVFFAIFTNFGNHVSYEAKNHQQILFSYLFIQLKDAGSVSENERIMSAYFFERNKYMNIPIFTVSLDWRKIIIISTYTISVQV